MKEIRVRVDANLADLIPAYLANRRSNLQEGWHALRNRDFNCLQRIGHRVRGTAASYGFDLLGTAAIDLEAAGIRRDPALARASLDQMDDFLRHLVIEFS